ncbi:MAG TPA: energy transducer TonB [Steroidobacteraceae bacterium]|nr:energy transducer TonB [Steroidobacteraceae bacterium]
MNAALRPPTPTVATGLSERCDVLVIGSDDAVLIELGSLLGDRYRVHAFDTADRIDAQVDATRWIGIIDADALAGAHGTLSGLEARYPRCPLIVITARPDAWVGSIARGAVLAAISRNQLATGRLGQVLLAAEDRLTFQRRQELKVEKPRVVSLQPAHFAPRSRRRKFAWAGATLLLALGVSVAGLYLRYATALRHHRTAGSVPPASLSPKQPRLASDATPARAAPEVERANPSASQSHNVLELLSSARVAFRDQRLLPEQLDGAMTGDSALELYVQVLRQDPQDDEALQGVKRLMVVGANRISADVSSGQLDDATRLLSVFRAAAAPAADLQQWANAISAAQPRWLAQRAAQTIDSGDLKAADELIAEASASGADAATVTALRRQEAAKKLELQLRTMAAQVHAAVAFGALLQPPIDNARTRLAAMRSIARNHPVTLQAQQEVQDALIQEGERATRSAHFDVAERDLNAAAELGSSTLLTLARSHLQIARAEVGHPVRVAAIVEPQPAGLPSRASATAARAPAALSLPQPLFIAARPTRALSVNYPTDGQGRDGSVVVEFTLSANGKASRVTVVQSDLPREFDREAISAVQHGRYSTSDLVNHQPVRARIKLRFIPG